MSASYVLLRRNNRCYITLFIKYWLNWSSTNNYTDKFLEDFNHIRLKPYQKLLIIIRYFFDKTKERMLKWIL